MSTTHRLSVEPRMELGLGWVASGRIDTAMPDHQGILLQPGVSLRVDLLHLVQVTFRKLVDTIFTNHGIPII